MDKYKSILARIAEIIKKITGVQKRDAETFRKAEQASTDAKLRQLRKQKDLL